MRTTQAFAITLLVLAFSQLAWGEDGVSFVGPVDFRAIEFVEYGGGPVRDYVAEEFSEIEVLYESERMKVIFTIALPRTTATKTVVVGLFLLVKKDDKWIIADSRRFEAIGKYSGGGCR